MIYASLKPIRHWHTPRVPLGYFALGHASGALLVVAVLRALDEPAFGFSIAAGLLLAIAAALKLDYYAYIAGDEGRISLEEAIGVPQGVAPGGARGTRMRARLFDVGHSRGTFLTDEFGYTLAAGRRTIFRVIVWIAGFALPAVWLASGATPGRWPHWLLHPASRDSVRSAGCSSRRRGTRCGCITEIARPDQALSSSCQAFDVASAVSTDPPTRMFEDDLPTNASANPTFEDICKLRRALLKGAAASATLSVAGLPLAGCSTASFQGAVAATPASPGFASVAVTTDDTDHDRRGLRGSRALCLGRPDLDRSRVQARRVEHRRRAGAAGRHASRRPCTSSRW